MKFSGEVLVTLLLFIKFAGSYIMFCVYRSDLSLSQECEVNLTFKNQSVKKKTKKTNQSNSHTRIKRKICMFISVHVEKAFQHLFTVKLLIKLNKRNFLSVKFTANIVLNNDILTLSP